MPHSQKTAASENQPEYLQPIGIDRLLIANRGEIACRVMHTAQRLGLQTVAVYSEADANALHVRMADAAVCIGPAAATESYLAIDRVIEAALNTGCQAIHPGYGFLSENASFARACERAGIIFVGPSAAAMDAMASKSAAKALMQEAGVPVLPGYHGEAQDHATLKAAADQTGYPLMLKASAGGGGKGMRIVDSAAEFDDMLTSVKRESAASFGDDRVLIERYLQRPRHIEIQVFSDTHGNHLHLFERDCSVQRRHQKVLEEAPAPGLDDEQRKAMGDAAVNAARSINYRGAGTVEFIADGDGEFFFMEMNTRLQVEHPVTEMITGHDLVEWQLRVASGQTLPCKQQDLAINGHAIEARIYAEDPLNQFLPDTGKLKKLQFPPPATDLRVETGVQENDQVSVHYDPMIAKLVVHAANRQLALKKLQYALANTYIIGPVTNVQYLQYLISQPDYASGQLDTGFIERLPDLTRQAEKQTRIPWLVLAACWRQATVHDGDAASHWRLNSSARDLAFWRTSGTPMLVSIQKVGEDYNVSIDHHTDTNTEADRQKTSQSTHQVRNVMMKGSRATAQIDGENFQAKIYSTQDNTNTQIGVFPGNLPDAEPLAASFSFERLDTGTIIGNSGSSDASLQAPMPGKIIAVEVEAGQKVKQGDTLMVLEAMKMEHSINAPRDGVVDEVHFSENDLVPAQASLLTLNDPD